MSKTFLHTIQVNGVLRVARLNKPNPGPAPWHHEPRGNPTFEPSVLHHDRHFRTGRGSVSKASAIKDPRKRSGGKPTKR